MYLVLAWCRLKTLILDSNQHSSLSPAICSHPVERQSIGSRSFYLLLLTRIPLKKVNQCYWCGWTIRKGNHIFCITFSVSQKYLHNFEQLWSSYFCYLIFSINWYIIIHLVGHQEICQIFPFVVCIFLSSVFSCKSFDSPPPKKNDVTSWQGLVSTSKLHQN